MHPRICITSERHPIGGQAAAHDRVLASYAWAVAEGGGIPLILPTVGYDPTLVTAYLDAADGLLFSGGEDIHPSFYGECVLEKCGPVDEKRDLFEIALFRGALERGVPVLGICRGMQLIAVAMGGSLYQDLSYCAGADAVHAGADDAMPSVTLTPGTLLHGILQETSVQANCHHHQLIKTLGESCTVNAVAADGVIEGIEVAAHPFVLGVHWHPERLADRDRHQLRMFEALVRAAADYAQRPTSRKDGGEELGRRAGKNA